MIVERNKLNCELIRRKFDSVIKTVDFTVNKQSLDWHKSKKGLGKR
jgi:hypothetical protein